MTVLRGGPAWPPMRHPFEVAAIVAFWLIGLFGLLGQGSPALAEYIHPLFLVLWNLALLAAATLGGLAALLAHRDPITSLLCERLFLGAIAPLALVFVAAVVARNGAAATNTITYFGVYSVAAVWRFRQAQKYLRWRQAHMAAQTDG